MNLVFGIIVATVVITVMIVIRIIASESVMKERLEASRSDSACDEQPCFNGCGSARFDSATGSAPDGKRRSAPHAS
jgi:hypothetical protein